MCAHLSTAVCDTVLFVTATIWAQTDRSAAKSTLHGTCWAPVCCLLSAAGVLPAFTGLRLAYMGICDTYTIKVPKFLLLSSHLALFPLFPFFFSILLSLVVRMFFFTSNIFCFSFFVSSVCYADPFFSQFFFVSSFFLQMKTWLTSPYRRLNDTVGH